MKINRIEWERTYGSEPVRHKNTYPSGEVISFMLRHFGDADRARVRCLDLGCG